MRSASLGSSSMRKAMSSSRLRVKSWSRLEEYLEEEVRTMQPVRATMSLGRSFFSSRIWRMWP